MVFMTMTITVGPTLFQILWNNKGVSDHFSLKQIDFIMVVINITYIMTLSLSILFLILGSTTEPGIIPRV